MSRKKIVSQINFLQHKNYDGESNVEPQLSDIKELRELTSAGIMDCKSALIEANGDIEQAEAISNRLMPFFETLFITSNPSPIKAAMNRLGFNVGKPRLPLIELTDIQEQKLEAVMNALNIV